MLPVKTLAAAALPVLLAGCMGGMPYVGRQPQRQAVLTPLPAAPAAPVMRSTLPPPSQAPAALPPAAPAMAGLPPPGAQPGMAPTPGLPPAGAPPAGIAGPATPMPGAPGAATSGAQVAGITPPLPSSMAAPAASTFSPGIAPAPGADPAPATLASATPPPASGGVEVGRTDLLGGWTVSSGGESCQLFMSLTSWSGGYRATTRGCSSPTLQGVSAWNLNGQQVSLVDESGGTVARLYPASKTQFQGQTEGGGSVSVAR